MNIKLLTERHLEFLSLKGGCTGSSESTLVKIPHCWKSHVTAHFIIVVYFSDGKTAKDADIHSIILPDIEIFK